MPIPEPVAFTVFGIDIMWYAIFVTTGIAVATIICCKRSGKHGIESDTLLNMIILSVPAGIIGARLYYVIFNWQYYGSDFFKIVNIREGGLAIHGGLIFGFAVAAILCFVWKQRPLNVMDLCLPAVALGQAIGRWGNYFNSEAHGGPTDLPWAVTVNGVTYHPTFLYESTWCLLLFIFLLYVDNRRQFEGQTTFLYGVLYSIERIFVEGLRTDSLMIGLLKQAQVISLVIIIVCAVCYVVFYRRYKRNNIQNQQKER